MPVYEASPLVDMHEAVSAWFLGPQAENFDLLKHLFDRALSDQATVRKNFHPEDGEFITAAIKESAVYKRNTQKLIKEFTYLSNLLNEHSVPFFSPRYAGHMCFETSMPAILGWILTILFNPNNVAFEASPITTRLEIEVCGQMCEMLGYKTLSNEVSPWGHIASDGTLANVESMWAARNLKYYPLSLQLAMRSGSPLHFISDSFEVDTCAEPRQRKLLRDLDTWELLNLRVQDILDIADRLHSEYGITAKFLESALREYIVQSTGKEDLLSKFGIDHPPQYLISNTKHYSWPKSAAILGIGSDNCVDVPVDDNARVDIQLLREALNDRLERKQAVYAVVAIIGSTEEGAVDPLDQIVELREEFQAKGLSFLVHADAAWGGYFATMLRDPPAGFPSNRDSTDVDTDADRDYVPTATLRKSTVSAFHALQHADSITIDPHKAGYIPYPAGGLCYRDGRMRFLLTWTAPYLHDADDGESIGIYGIEGSKPGAPAAAVYLHHAVVGLHKEGHGGLLGEVSFTCRRISAHWAAMSDANTSFIVVPFNAFVNEGDDAAIEEEKIFIRENILGKSNEAVVKDERAMDELCALGSDLNINAFACNFRINGKTNEDVEEANYLNNRIFKRLSMTKVKTLPKDVPLFLSSTVFAYKDYGQCVKNFERRLGLEIESDQDLFVLRNVCMSPFQTAGNFCQSIADTFQSILEEEIEHVIERNTITPDTHTFVMQGTDKLYLVYRPYFHKANSRYQLILSADIPDFTSWNKYISARHANSREVLTLSTAEPVTLDDLIKKKSFSAYIEGKGLSLSNVPVFNVRVIKMRPLDSKWRDPVYPRNTTPFYLYGTPQQQHVEHMLLRAPNAQLASDQVTLTLDKGVTLSREQLARGVLVYVSRPERAMQPFGSANPPEFFAPNASFRISVAIDPRHAAARGPGLASVGPEANVGEGTLTLGKAVYVDHERVNTQDFAPNPCVENYATEGASMATKAEWKDLVRSSLGGLPGETTMVKVTSLGGGELGGMSPEGGRLLEGSTA